MRTQTKYIHKYVPPQHTLTHKQILACKLSLHRIVVGVTTSDSGDGIIYKLSVTQDVSLETPATNYNYLEYLLVGKIPQYPNKRSLLQFENLPNGCRSVSISKHQDRGQDKRPNALQNVSFKSINIY